MNEYTFNFPTALIHDFTGEQHKVREPVFRRMPDNSFLCLFLTGGPTEPHDRNVVMAIRSEDYGKTWSEPTETDIPNSYTKLTVKKIEGKILLISNFHPSMEWQNRKCLQMWASDDNCKSWSKKISLAADNDVLFYPHAYADDEQKILYITFENGMQHYIQTIPYEEFHHMV